VQLADAASANVRRWAVGVLIFEMVAGYPPFYSENKVEMFKVWSLSLHCMLPAQRLYLRPAKQGTLGTINSDLQAICDVRYDMPAHFSKVR